MKRTVLLPVLVATFVVVLVACGSDSGTDEPTGDGGSSTTRPSGSGSGGDLDGTTYVSTTVTGHDLVPGTEIVLTFEDGSIGVQAGCNSIGGSYAVDGGTLVLEGELNSTMMGCDADRQAQDEWVSGFLSSEPTIAVDGDTLTLAGDGVTLELVDQAVADPARPLVGTTWTATTIVEGDAASSIPSGVTPPTLVIGEDGRTAIFTGCNSGGASVEVGDTSLVFEPMVTTMMACGGGADEVQAAVVATLAGETTFEIEGSTLTITAGDRGLVFTTT